MPCGVRAGLAALAFLAVAAAPAAGQVGVPDPVQQSQAIDRQLSRYRQQYAEVSANEVELLAQSMWRARPRTPPTSSWPASTSSVQEALTRADRGPAGARRRRGGVGRRHRPRCTTPAPRRPPPQDVLRRQALDAYVDQGRFGVLAGGLAAHQRRGRPHRAVLRPARRRRPGRPADHAAGDARGGRPRPRRAAAAAAADGGVHGGRPRARAGRRAAGARRAGGGAAAGRRRGGQRGAGAGRSAAAAGGVPVADRPARRPSPARSPRCSASAAAPRRRPPTAAKVAGRAEADRTAEARPAADGQAGTPATDAGTGATGRHAGAGHHGAGTGATTPAPATGHELPAGLRRPGKPPVSVALSYPMPGCADRVDVRHARPTRCSTPASCTRASTSGRPRAHRSTPPAPAP